MIPPVLGGIGLVLISTLLIDDEGAKAPGKAPLDLGDDPVFAGTVKFLDTNAGDLYRSGLDSLRKRDYTEAARSFERGLSKVREKSEVEIFQRLVKEGKAGVELDKIARVASTRGKAGALAGIRELERSMPRLEGLRLAREYEALRLELRDLLYHVIDDFEGEGQEAEGSEEDGGAGGEEPPRREPPAEEEPKKTGGSGKAGGGSGPSGKGGAGPSGRGGSGRSGRGGFGGRGGFRGWGEALSGGEIQDARKDPSTVREGKHSYRWPVGRDLRARIYELDPGLLEEYSLLGFSIRGSANVTTQVTIYLLEENTEPAAILFGTYKGYNHRVSVRGPAWKDHRIDILKEMKAQNDPDKKRIAQLILVVQGQPEQVLYLDDIKLEL